jgi:hypothetical protein
MSQQRQKGLGKLKKKKRFNDLIGNRIRDLPPCSNVPFTGILLNEVLPYKLNSAEVEKPFVYVQIPFDVHACLKQWPTSQMLLSEPPDYTGIHK